MPTNAVSRVISLDAGEMYDAGIAVPYDGNAGEFPQVVLMHKITYEEHCENVSLASVPNEYILATTSLRGFFFQEGV